MFGGANRDDIAVATGAESGDVERDVASRDVGPAPASGDVEPDVMSRDVGTERPSSASEEPRAPIPSFDPASTPTWSDIDLGRLAAAVATLDPGAACPELVAVESLENVAEVVRISGGCLIVEHLPFEGRSIPEIRESLATDPEIHAGGSPVLEVWSAQAGSFTNDPDSGAAPWGTMNVIDSTRMAMALM